MTQALYAHMNNKKNFFKQINKVMKSTGSTKKKVIAKVFVEHSNTL
jgi:hypothetical protein